MNPPRATYRLQMRAAFGFKDAAAIASYLARLGVSHAYLSPIFKARPGSPHGYDITDHGKLNPELGSEADYAAMIAAFRREGLGLILDIVPNHMGVGGADNPLWLDVLEWGPESRYAGWFDIDWEAGNGKLLAPLLGAQYGEELRAGKLKLKFAEDGTFAVWAYETHKLPVWPLTYPTILGHRTQALDRMSDQYLDLPNWGPEVAERARELDAELRDLAIRDPQAGAEVERRVESFNADWRELDRLIALQHWRVAFFRVAADEINYRRFFNINELAGLRMELRPVFARVHARVFEMQSAGEIDGLRIDHIDGLLDPKSYLFALRERSKELFYLVVEKILAPHERLRGDWPVNGTTGYDYLNLVLGLLVDPAGEDACTNAYRAFAGVEDGFEKIARDSKLRIMDNEMASELNALARAAAGLARESPMTADLTRAILKRAIKAIVANFPVYRTYADLSGELSEEDKRDIAWALARARRFDPDIHSSAFDFLEAVLMGEIKEAGALEISGAAALRVAMRLQQFSGPVMAKGVEDTAFYRFNRFIALNEVGGSPDRFGIAPQFMHKANAERAERWPHAMLATSTHDTKRGEDSRARLAALSELAEEWRREVTGWSRLLRARLGDVEGKAPPDRNDEYMFYQMLIGSWPMEMLEDPSGPALATFGARLNEALRKSLREGKRNSSWFAPDVEYENAMQRFASEALNPESAFLAGFLPFVRRAARLGVENSLVQTVLKLTAPGVPDTYQGCELWNFDLVDPDNRRAVDYSARAGALRAIGGGLEHKRGRADLFEALMRDWRDGQIKLATTALLLNFRRAHPEIFAKGGYRPIEVEGDDSNCVFAYLRGGEEARLAIIVARFPALRERKPDWRAKVKLPAGEWTDLFRGRALEPGADLRGWLGPLPVAALIEA